MAVHHRAVGLGIWIACCLSGAPSEATVAAYTEVKFPNDNSTKLDVINSAGFVAGEHGSGIPSHAFVRTPDGAFTDFAVDGAGVTVPRTLADDGTIGGRFDSGEDTVHGFFRDAAGVITTFDGPGLGAADIIGMNARHDILGTYFLDDQRNLGGFIRHADGSFTLFAVDDPQPTGLWLAGIDAHGRVAGHYADKNFVNHGFVRSPRGRITSFEAPGAVSTEVLVLNDKGWVAGFYTDANGAVHGYLRKADGIFEVFDRPAEPVQITALNNRGEIAGCYSAHFRDHGFVRKASGKLVRFNLPWGKTENMCVDGINDSGQVAGYARYGRNEFGFIRTP